MGQVRCCRYRRHRQEQAPWCLTLSLSSALGVGLVWVPGCPVIIVVPSRSGAHRCLLCEGLNW